MESVRMRCWLICGRWQASCGSNESHYPFSMTNKATGDNMNKSRANKWLPLPTSNRRSARWQAPCFRSCTDQGLIPAACWHAVPPARSLLAASRRQTYFLLLRNEELLMSKSICPQPKKRNAMYDSHWPTLSKRLTNDKVENKERILSSPKSGRWWCGSFCGWKRNIFALAPILRWKL
jgi:hypothetical protein